MTRAAPQVFSGRGTPKDHSRRMPPDGHVR
jgi:hypothetical protein